MEKDNRIEEGKFCRACGRTLPLSEFDKLSSRKDGLQTQCKSCRKIQRQMKAELRRVEANERRIEKENAEQQHFQSLPKDKLYTWYPRVRLWLQREINSACAKKTTIRELRKSLQDEVLYCLIEEYPEDATDEEIRAAITRIANRLYMRVWRQKEPELDTIGVGRKTSVKDADSFTEAAEGIWNEAYAKMNTREPTRVWIDPSRIEPISKPEPEEFDFLNVFLEQISKRR